jgi:hypothetical protein
MDAANSVKLIGGRAQLILPPHGSAVFANIPIGPGAWEIKTQGGGAAAVHIASSLPAPAGCDSCVGAATPTSANLRATNTTDQPAALESLVLTRR